VHSGIPYPILEVCSDDSTTPNHHSRPSLSGVSIVVFPSGGPANLLRLFPLPVVSCLSDIGQNEEQDVEPTLLFADPGYRIAGFGTALEPISNGNAPRVAKTVQLDRP